MDFGFSLLKKGKGEEIETEIVLGVSSCNRHFYLPQNVLSIHSYIWKMTTETSECVFLHLRAFVAMCSDSRMTAADEK